MPEYNAQQPYNFELATDEAAYGSLERDREDQKFMDEENEVEEEIMRQERYNFSSECFSLLAQTLENESISFIRENEIHFNKYIIYPFSSLLKEVGSSLSKEIKHTLETRKNLIRNNPFHKNIWGQGGKAWPFLWGSFHVKNGNKQISPQLFIWINKDRFEFGFYIGEFGENATTLYNENISKYHKKISKLYVDTPQDIKVFTRNNEIEYGPVTYNQNNHYTSICEYLSTPSTREIYISKSIPKENCIDLDCDDIIDIIVETFHILYPFVVLATHKDPLTKIATYYQPTPEKHKVITPYTIEQISKDCFTDSSIINEWLHTLLHKKQCILTGPPGTGKTFIGKKIAKHITTQDDGIMDTVQFHPSYCYEDFIQGIRPQTNSKGIVEYPVKDGRFVEFCKQAKQRSGLCVFFIDEINRANVAQVFGELLNLLEYRNESIRLPSGTLFTIPNNVLIIGTMNTADRSLDLVDHALRRRFSSIEIEPNYEAITRKHNGSKLSKEVITILEEINKDIDDRRYNIGISYFMHDELENTIESTWKHEIYPYISELFFDQQTTAKNYSWNNIKHRLLP